ncbi:hypothetical protein BMF89_14520 [Arthrobacter sp. SRS-W-1-2016]|uniref:hypothetical protein n=1 Tax=Arthrobacter sp. SRS-W-1-2016 TaxID=1930254 RepID=UPI000990C939|nr:hypothetical protein [Arthrobacter sp. SRS-W-1-2016]OOP61044.1 hypothetical protein BMF89_14520 [Arthrobacter sp. SRS-W-1-2016]
MIPKKLMLVFAAVLLLGLTGATGTHPSADTAPDAAPAPIANAAPAAEVAPLAAPTPAPPAVPQPAAAPTPAPPAVPQPAAAPAPAVVVPQAGSVKVLDTTAAITDPNWFRQAYGEGFRLYVMHSTAWGTCTPWQQTQAQLKMALDAGLKIAVYTRDASCWENGIKAAGPYVSQLQFFALDIEPGGSLVTRAMVDGVRSLGVRPVIYSGSGMWPGLMGKSTAFSDVPLWDTDTSNLNYARWTADYLAPAPVQYGGWNTSSTMRVGVQQKFEHTLNGINVDLNSFNASFLK